MKARFLALAALVLGLASCQTEPEGLDVNVGGEVDTYVTVALPETETRANSALGAFDNVVASNDYTIRYIFQVFYGDATTPQQVIYSDEKSVSFPVRLVSGRTYSFVAWADVAKKNDEGEWVAMHYNTENLKNVTFDVAAWKAMDETRDAFTDVQTVVYNGTTGFNLQLKRPFAKLRVLTTDMVELGNLNIVPAGVHVKYNVPVYDKFNALSGNVITTSSISEKVFEYDLTDEDLKNYYESTATTKTLFTNYLFGAENGVIKFEMTVNDNQVTPELIKYNNFTTDIPVQRNYLTTISGNILTDGNNITVTVENDGAFAGEKVEEIVEVGNATDLQEAINESTENTTIVLGSNIVLGDGSITLATTRAEAPQYALLVPAGKVVNLDLNGKTISQVKACTDNYSMLVNKGNLTITGNGTISFKDTGAGDPNFGWGSYTLRNEGTLVVENGTIEHLGAQNPGNGQPNVHMYCAIFQYSGKSTINGGVISTPTYRSARLWNGEMTINGGQFVGQLWLQAVSDNANLVINGGEFSARGNDGSSVFVSNSGKAVKCSINGGLFNNKVGMSEPIACITGGTFTSVAKEGTAIALLDSDYDFVADGDNWTVKRKGDVAKIGEVGYTSLAKAVAAVEDGGTITLVANEVFTEKNYYDNGGWKDGLGYAGDKSFTIDLNSKTIGQDGALNDYLIWIKNDGSKANTITLKNGTLDAGTTAYCAFATASSNKQKITINLENVNLIGNNSNGAVAKIRGGAELNVKAGTVITGKNNYVGIEAAGNNTVVNIYDGVNIYQNGTSSYVGAIVGASQNATMNIYGGYGKSAKCGIIVMSTGATINVSGGEWIANNDGTVATDNNAVLVSQNNRYETGWACKSILNVTGGTFKGGYNCYGMGPGVEPNDAQINIKGGDFNANPASYVVAGYESVEKNGVYTVGKPQALAAFEAAIAQGGEVTLSADITLLESVKIEGKTVVLDLNGKTVTAPLFSAFEVKNGAELTIKNGKVVAYESTVRAIGGKAVIESGEYTSTGTAADSPATNRYSLDCREGGELIINGGTFKSNNGMINVGSTVTINGGKFENVVEKTITRHFAYVSAPLTINDGEFYGKANSSAGGCFFCGAGASGYIQINGGKFTSLWTSGSVNRIFEVYFGGTINVTGGMFNTNGGIATFVTENTDEATKAAYPYVAK